MMNSKTSKTEIVQSRLLTGKTTKLIQRLLLAIFIMAGMQHASAQLNLKWSHTQSLSGGVYQSHPIEMMQDSSGNIYASSNETINAAGDIQGHISKYDSSGNLQWNLAVSPATLRGNFPTAICNTSPTTSHLIKINPNGTIAWDVVVNGMNNITSIYEDVGGMWLVGRTPQTTCGAFQCNGIAVAKYDTNGVQQWIQTNYTTGYFTMPSQIVTDNAGNVIVSGNKVAYTGSGNDRDPFVAKYTPTGSAIWLEEITEPLSDTGCIHWLRVDNNNDIYLASQVTDVTNTTKLRKLSGSNGTELWTQTINNSGLRGLQSTDQTAILSTSTGMFAYNVAGTLMWSNNYIVEVQYTDSVPGANDFQLTAIATNVSPTDIQRKYLLNISCNTGNLLYLKDITVGNHEEFAGYHRDVLGVWQSGVSMLIEDTAAPYGTRVTKLSPCSSFTYGFTASTSFTNVTAPNYNNGSITVNWTGTFNSWAHLEIYDDQTGLEIAQSDPGGASYTFQNLTSGSYTVKMFDESCSGQNFNVNILPTATISGNSTVCLSQPASVTLAFTGTLPFTYTISDGTQSVSGTAFTNPTTVQITPTTVGSHNYILTSFSDANIQGTTSGSAVVNINALGNGLTGNWRFDGDGDDQTTGNYDLTLTGNPAFVAGKFGQAMSLDGTGNQYAIRPMDDAAFNFGSTDFSVAIWVNFNTISGEQTLIEKFTGIAGPGWTLTKLPSQQLQFYTGTPMNSSVLNISTGAWHLCAATRSGNTFKIYFDGVEVGSFTNGSVIPNTTKPFLIGRRDGSQVFGLNGLIDDAGVWSRTLSAAEITQIWNDGISTTASATINASGPTTFCAGGSVTLTSSPAASYSWSTGATTQSISVNTANTVTVTVTDGNGCTGSASAAVQVNPNPMITISGNTSICQGGSTTLTANGGDTYTWSPATGLNTTTGSTVIATPANSYTVTVTGANGFGCTASTATTVQVNPNPMITISGNTSICQGGSTTLTANGGDTYTWSPATGLNTTTGSTVIATPANSYTVTVTGANGFGCTASTATTVQVNPNPMITISGNTSICQGGSTTLTANGGDTYTWSPATGLNTTTGSTVIATPANSYTVTVTGANGFGCTASTATTVQVNPNPMITISGNTSICQGGSTTLTANGGDTYTWSPATGLNTTTGSTVIATPANSYTVTVTGANGFGCTASTATTVQVNPNPMITISGNTSICQGGSTTLTANGGDTYTWSPATGLNTTTGSTVIATPANSYTVTVTGANGFGCTASTATTVQVNPNPMITISGNTSICQGGSTTLTANGGDTYTWSPATGLNTTTGSTVIATPANSYTVTVTGANGFGCTASTATTVQVNPNPMITISGNTSICQGGSTTLTANGGDTYIWSPATGLNTTTGSTVIATPANSYTVTVTGANGFGCTASISTTVTVSTAPPTGSVTSITAPARACAGDVSLLTANNVAGQNVQYRWRLGVSTSVVSFSNNIGGPFSAPPFETTTRTVYVQFGALGASATTYTVTSEAFNGCGSTNIFTKSIAGKAAMPGTVTGAAVACPNDLKNYSCGASSGASLYNWTLSGTTSSIFSGQGTQNIIVSFPAGFTSGQMCVTAQFACGASSVGAPRCKTISNAPATPGAMTGPSSVCPGSTGNTFSVAAVAEATGYNWTVPAGATITSGAGSNTIQLAFSAAYSSGTVRVAALSACGASPLRSKTINSSVPSKPSAITGPTTNICNSTVQFSIPAVTNATSYNWTPPAGTSITSGQGTSVILLSVGSSFTSGSLSVTANTNLCTPGASSPRTLTIYGKPATPSVITANPGSWCNGGSVNFSVIPVSLSPVYNWTVTNGTITSGQGSTNIDVTWGTGAGYVVAVASNTCGFSGASSQYYSPGCREGELTGTDIFGITVYPNPAGSVLEIRTSANFQNTTLQLKNVLGQIAFEKNTGVLNENTPLQINVADLPTGIYLLQLNTEEGIISTRIVKE